MSESVAIFAMSKQEKSCDNRTGSLLRFSQNGQMDIDWIRKGLMKPGKSQRGLAAALGLDPSAINRLLKGGRQLKASEIEKVRAYLDEPSTGRSADAQSDNINRAQQGTGDRIKVLGMGECGPDGWALWNGEVVDMVPRPPFLSGAPQGYAVFATGDSMSPRYEAGDLIYIHPGKPVTPGCFVLVQVLGKAEGDGPRAVIKRLGRRSGNKVVLEQFNPAKTFTLNTAEIVSMHRVVGSGEA